MGMIKVTSGDTFASSGSREILRKCGSTTMENAIRDELDLIEELKYDEHIAITM